MTDRRRQYELVFALTPVANESEASTIVEGASEYVSNQGCLRSVDSVPEGGPYLVFGYSTSFKTL